VSVSCCSLLQLGTESGEIESFPTAPGVEGKSILYSDDFSKSNSDWDTGLRDNGGADYCNGGYRINVPSEINISAYLHQSFQKDVIVEMDASRILDEDTSKDFWAGIYVRHTSDGYGYLFEIHNDKGIGVVSMNYIYQGKSHSIGTIEKHWKWPPNWGETYHIRIDAIGDQLSLYVNGYLVESATDSSISSGGEIGFFGGRDEYGERQYLFDNLVVYAADKEGSAATEQAATNAEEAADQKETVATESSNAAKEAPAIKLAIYEGSTIEGNICYYRVKATVTGSPNPVVIFSKDDSGGAWGSNKVQINLNSPGDTYTLKATATNSGGSATDSLTLSW
jgi:hypothetical protein